MSEFKLFNTEIYLLSPTDDRAYFVDETAEDAPVGLCERYGVTLAERPSIPTAEMRYDEIVVPGRHSSYKRQEGHDDIEIPLSFNFISPEPREVYLSVANYLRTLEPGTRFRLSNDNDGTYRVLARTPRVDPLNSDLDEWGDFIVHVILEPFRYIEEPEVTIEPDAPVTLTPSVINAMDTPQIIEHMEVSETNTVTWNEQEVYSIDEDIPVDSFIVDGIMQYTYGEERSSGSGYPLHFYNNFNSLRMVFEKEPYEGFNYNDVDMPSDLRTNFSGDYIHFDVRTHSVNVPDGAPDSFLRFLDVNGNEIEKPIHAEQATLDYTTSHETDPDEINEEEFNIGIVASEGQRFIFLQFNNASRHRTRVTVETENQTFEPYEAQQGRNSYYFEDDEEVTITAQDAHGVEPAVTHTFRTTQKGGEVLGIKNMNRYMRGGFLELRGASNVIESTSTIKFRPLWRFL